MKCIAISNNFSKEGMIPGLCISEQHFNYKKGSLLDAQDIVLDTKGKKGDIALVILAIEFKTAGEIMYNRDPKWLPAAVVAMGRLKG